MSKIGIIGVGHVGSHVASQIVSQGICDDLVLIDKNEALLKSHSLDIMDSLTYMPKFCRISYGKYEELVDADIVVMAACDVITTEDRLDEFAGSKKVMDEIIPLLLNSGFKGIIVSITNPCDLIAQYLAEKTNLTVLGTGTTLDTSRMKVALGQILDVHPNSIDGYVIGEHGDSQVCVFSSVKIGGIPFKEYITNVDINLDKIRSEVKERAYLIFDGKKCTEFAIGVTAVCLIKAILYNTHEILPVSYYVNKYNVNDLYLSLPCVVGRNGVEKTIYLPLDEKEEKDFYHSATILRKLKEKF